VKQYIEKIFEGTSYSLNCDFFNTDFFKKLIVPNNSQGIQGTNDRFILGTISATKTILNSNTPTARNANLSFDSTTLLNFTENAGKSIFTYTDGTKTVNALATITGIYQTDAASSITATLYVAGVAVQTLTVNTFSANNPFTFNIDWTGAIANTNEVRIELSVPVTANTYIVNVSNANFTFNGFTNGVAGSSATVIITQASPGSRLLTSTMKYANASKTLSTTTGAIDIISVFYDGTTYYATLSKGYA
jgi:hypothetical protein